MTGPFIPMQHGATTVWVNAANIAYIEEAGERSCRVRLIDDRLPVLTADESASALTLRIRDGLADWAAGQ
jgi:hypothetical protein